MDSLTKKPQEVQQQAFSNEDEIKILERRLQLLREGPQAEQESGEEAAAETKESAEAAEGGMGEVPSGAPTPQPVSPVAPEDSHYHDTKVGELKTYESDKQLKALVEIAFERSVADAIDIARKLDDAHLLDAFHDTLQDDGRVRSTLVESGKLKEI